MNDPDRIPEQTALEAFKNDGVVFMLEGDETGGTACCAMNSDRIAACFARLDHRPLDDDHWSTMVKQNDGDCARAAKMMVELYGGQEGFVVFTLAPDLFAKFDAQLPKALEPTVVENVKVTSVERNHE